MATKFPLYNQQLGAGLYNDETTSYPPLQTSLNDDILLQQLLGPEDDQLLTSLLASTNANGTGSIEPQFNFDFDLNPLLNVPTSPVTSDLSTSNSPSYSNQGHSPESFTSGSDGLGDSPTNPSPYMMEPFSVSMGISEPTLEDLVTSTMAEAQSCSLNTGVSAEVKIDVDYMTTDELGARQTAASTEWSESNKKAPTLLLSEEEKKLLAEEGVALPTDMPLTKAELKDLKKVRRKIKNKISAQESRKRKKEYIDGLEDRVKICTNRNKELKREVDCLKQQNTSLMSQLKKLQAIVGQYNPSKAQAGSMLLVIVMSFSMFFIPKFKHYGGPQAMMSMSRSSRTLLFTETDQFGNVVDPDSGSVISRVGGQSPNFPPPWVYQTPALFSTRPNLPDKFDAHFPIEPNTVVQPSEEKQTETESIVNVNSSVENSKTTSNKQHR